jgi:hypothetical protein
MTRLQQRFKGVVDHFEVKLAQRFSTTALLTLHTYENPGSNRSPWLVSSRSGVQLGTGLPARTGDHLPAPPFATAVETVAVEVNEQPVAVAEVVETHQVN